MIGDPVMAARIRRFEQLGGIDLSRVEPEEKPLLMAGVRAGLAPVKRGMFRFRCPTCGKVETSDQELEPACTGPSWRDDHPLEPMMRLPDSFAP
jgi:hypothetical protein